MPLSYFSTIWVAVLLLTYACGSSSPQENRTLQVLNGKTMGTTYQIKWIGSTSQISQSVVDSLLEVINESMSTYREESLISRINKSEDTSVVFILDPHFDYVLQLSNEIYHASDGYFNPAVYPLVKAWGFAGKPLADSLTQQIDSLLAWTQWNHFLWGDTLIEGVPFRWLKKKHPKAGIDFSAVAKGYGVDAVGLLLESSGIVDYMVEIGGEVRCRGKNQEGNGWRIGIDKPDASKSSGSVYQQVIPLDDMSIATSGNYRNYIEHQGKRVGHSMNPKTGKPEINAILSASILDGQCAVADAWATAIMSGGLNRAKEWLQKGNLEGMIIFNDSLTQEVEIYQTSRWPGVSLP